ncbi:uncharacterized protein LOC121242446 [Juglans microcarpa x Juglans regia]|uniref:uncharacterized protein LOC121242446 n=1 Tax=Juglans microcarpa x Juglans regia TaxID=2249226 RepID=UPI001B7DB66C|nr:uncharacterized protein LOC121242446 [Juglans microcarpa x Juglans regia]
MVCNNPNGLLSVMLNSIYDDKNDGVEFAWHRHFKETLKEVGQEILISMLAISEPFVKEDSMFRFAQYLDFSNYCSNEAIGGKMWVMWNGQDDFEVESMSDQMITGWVVVNGSKVLVTFVYVKCSFSDCMGLWFDLEALLVGLNPWIIVGDFNIIREDMEQIGGQPRPLGAMEEFNNCLNNCVMVELTSQGGCMSWFNGHAGQTRRWAKLDRAVWMEPVHGAGMCKLASKLKKAKIALKRWNEEVFGRVDVTIKELESRILYLEEQLKREYDQEVETKFQCELDYWEKRGGDACIPNCEEAMVSGG